MSDGQAAEERAEHPAYGTPRRVTPTATVLLAENPSPMTLDGTNTWLLAAPGAEHHVVVDPGPDDEDHLTRVAAQGPVSQILLTHGHPDHAAGAHRFAEMVDAPVRALDPALRVGGDGLVEGDLVESAGLRLRVMGTPGHTADSLCLQVLPAGDGIGESAGATAVLTGDTVLGRGTTVVAHPDGRLADYLESLRRLAGLPAGTVLLPGHGPELPDLAGAAAAYLAHREQRLDQVRAALRRLGPDASPSDVVADVYADVDRAVWPAAEQTVRAQLEYLNR